VVEAVSDAEVPRGPAKPAAPPLLASDAGSPLAPSVHDDTVVVDVDEDGVGAPLLPPLLPRPPKTVEPGLEVRQPDNRRVLF
jgi:hypothetical protein